MSIGGVEITGQLRRSRIDSPDPIRGELRRVPERGARRSPSVSTRHCSSFPLARHRIAQRVVVRASSFSSEPVSGTLRLRVPTGWAVSPAEAPFTLDDTRASRRPRRSRSPRRRIGSREASTSMPRLVSAGDTFTRDVQVVSYPHIQTHRLYWPARARAQVVDLKVAAGAARIS